MSSCLKLEEARMHQPALVPPHSRPSAFRLTVISAQHVATSTQPLADIAFPPKRFVAYAQPYRKSQFMLVSSAGSVEKGRQQATRAKYSGQAQRIQPKANPPRHSRTRRLRAKISRLLLVCDAFRARTVAATVSVLSDTCEHD